MSATMINPNEIMECLQGATYPANREDLVDCARQNGADEAIIDALLDLPDHQYDDADAVSSELTT